MSYSDRGRITLEMIEALKNQGLNQSEIAARFNITKQAVSYHKATYNGAKTPRELVLENFPWKVPEAHIRFLQWIQSLARDTWLIVVDVHR